MDKYAHSLCHHRHGLLISQISKSAQILHTPHRFSPHHLASCVLYCLVQLRFKCPAADFPYPKEFCREKCSSVQNLDISKPGSSFAVILTYPWMVKSLVLCGMFFLLNEALDIHFWIAHKNALTGMLQRYSKYHLMTSCIPRITLELHCDTTSAHFSPFYPNMIHILWNLSTVLTTILSYLGMCESSFSAQHANCSLPTYSYLNTNIFLRKRLTSENTMSMQLFGEWQVQSCGLPHFSFVSLREPCFF